MQDRQTYVYQEFPKWKYHKDGRSIIVKNAEEEKSLGRGWYNNPGEAKKAAEPSALVKALDDTAKPWWSKWGWIFAALAAILGLVGTIIKLWKKS